MTIKAKVGTYILPRYAFAFPLLSVCCMCSLVVTKRVRVYVGWLRVVAATAKQAGNTSFPFLAFPVGFPSMFYAARDQDSDIIPYWVVIMDAFYEQLQIKEIKSP